MLALVSALSRDQLHAWMLILYVMGGAHMRTETFTLPANRGADSDSDDGDSVDDNFLVDDNHPATDDEFDANTLMLRTLFSFPMK